MGRDDNGIMQYTIDLKNIYFLLSEEYVRSVFLNFVACYFPLHQTYRKSQIIVTATKQLLLEEILICFSFGC